MELTEPIHEEVDEEQKAGTPFNQSQKKFTAFTKGRNRNKNDGLREESIERFKEITPRNKAQTKAFEIPT